MLKKIIAASAMLLFAACSSVDDGFVYGSSDSQGNVTNDSSSSQDNPSSSSSSLSPSSSSTPSSSSEPEPSSASKGPEAVLIANLGSGGGISVLFGTYPYGFTLKDSENEDLTKFWTCPPEQNDDLTAAEIIACRDTVAQETGAILQNLLTTKNSPLHYIIDNMRTSDASQRAVQLTKYNLTGPGDQAAIGLDINSSKLDTLAGAVAFTYYYKGGAHKFRIAIDDADYWEASVPATTEETMMTIKVSDFEKPFDISKATKFLWMVEFDEDKSENNTGSLLLYLFKALVEKEN